MKKMTKWLALLLAGLLMSASLFACGGDDGWTPDEDEDEEQVEKDDKDSDDKDDDEDADEDKDNDKEATKEQTKAPETDAPETEAPETEAPETEAPETEAPETEAPETEAPETEAPETEAPETDAPETDAPVTDAPVTDAPGIDQPITSEGKYENLKPSELYNALAQADQVAIGAIADGTYAAIGKNGNIVSIFQGTSETEGTLFYADYGEKLLYAQVDGEWYKAPMNDDFYGSWQELLELMKLTPDMYLFNDDYFDAFTETDTVLTIKESMLAGSDFSSIKLEREGLRYTLSETYTDGETIQTMFSFEALNIELPEAKVYETEGEQGEAKPDDPADLPDEPEEEGAYDDMTPAAFYKALISADDVYITMKKPDDKLIIEKTGDLLRVVNHADAEGEQTLYYDLAEDYGYIMQNEQWVKQALDKDYTWVGMLEDLGFTADNRFFNEDNYEPFEEGDYFWYIKADLLKEGEAEASFYCSGDYYSLDIEYADYTEVSFSAMFSSCYVSLPEVN